MPYVAFFFLFCSTSVIIISKAHIDTCMLSLFIFPNKYKYNEIRMLRCVFIFFVMISIMHVFRRRCWGVGFFSNNRYSIYHTSYVNRMRMLNAQCSILIFSIRFMLASIFYYVLFILKPIHCIHNYGNRNLFLCHS